MGSQNTQSALPQSSSHPSSTLALGTGAGRHNHYMSIGSNLVNKSSKALMSQQ